MAVACFKAWVYGKVQGVGFRYSTQAKANDLGVQGYAHNLEDGSVEVLAWGEAELVQELILWLKEGGPRSAEIDRVLVQPHRTDNPPHGFTTG
ncbi:acylphosphatase [Candidatus Pantoea multigeneris]|uniref:Acylphosphatase n=1 Tax=Candidatus Pantoea multigeneris TaxID=2608357 RepID=A0ABX0RBL2_9GAMM|nr:acylphosphatase [Pantoea multigeneris]NIF20635.1 acylphosphatase [Pantoea multigeneris]